MTELQLYKFVTENSLEYHWYKNDKDKEEVFLFVPSYYVEEFNKMFDYTILDEYGLKCTMKEGYFVFEMEYICGFYDIEMENVFTNKDINYH